MPPILPANYDHPNEGSDDELRNICNGDSVMIIPLDTPEDSDGYVSPSHDGYQLLAHDILDEENSIESSEESEDEPEEIGTSSAVGHTEEINSEDCVNKPESCQKVNDDMGPEHIEKIKAVMKSITLPEHNLPVWTSVIAEDEWKAALYARLNITVLNKTSAENMNT